MLTKNALSSCQLISSSEYDILILCFCQKRLCQTQEINGNINSISSNTDMYK